MSNDNPVRSQPGGNAARPTMPPERLPGEAASAGARDNPYVGPRAFQTGEALYGRDREVEDLFDLLVARRIALLYAPSGAGKTSLVQAGLIPRLRAEGFADLPIVRVNLAAQPGAPNRYLSSVIASLRGHAAATPPAEGRAARETEQAPALDGYLAEQESSLAGSPVLILDQFEEIFTADPTDVEAKRAFFAALGSVLQKPNRWALFVMREEFVGALEPYARYIPTRLAASMRLDLLGVAAARDAIRKPAETVMEEAAVEALIEDLRVVRVQQPDGSVQRRQGPYVEPSQLQVVCYRLWEQPRPDHRRITAADVMAAASGMGAVDAALAGYYADRVSAVATTYRASERLVREWFERRLITPQGVRALVLREAGEASGDGRLPDAVIRALVDAHLVRAEERRGATWYELAHDRLIEPVRENNREWAEAHLHALQRGADVWNQQARHDGFLLTGKALGDAEAWAAAHPEELTALDRDYLRESRQVAAAAAAKEERDRQAYELDAARRIAENERAARRRQSVLTTALAIVALLALVAFGVSLWQTAEANFHRDLAREAEADAAAQRDVAQKASTAAAAQRDTAESQSKLALARELASNAALQLGADPEVTTLLALESLKLTYTPEADSLAWTGASLSYQHLTLASNAPVDRALFSADGKRVLTFGRQAAAQGRVANPALWDAESGKRLVELVGHKSEITDAAWSPDGRLVATASTDNTAIVWDAASGRQLALLGGARADVTRVVWSRDGRRVAVVHRPGFVRIYNASGGEALREFAHQGEVNDLAWGPADRVLATVGTDRSVHLWDISTGRSLRVLSGHDDAIRLVAWSPGGNLLATGSSDGTARIWEVESGKPVAVLSGHEKAVFSLAWHPKGNALVTGDGDGAVRVWRAPSGELLRELSGHWGMVLDIAFAPNGERLATAAEDATARVWNFEKGLELFFLRGHQGNVTSAMFSPDGKRLLTGSSTDHTARIWDVTQPAPVSVSLGHSLTTVAWSADGATIAAGGGNVVSLWNIQSGVAETVASGDERIDALAFAPRDRRLAVGTSPDDGTGNLAIRNLATGASVSMSESHDRLIRSLAWSPDGSRIASGSEDATVRVWDAATGRSLARLTADNPVLAIAWSRDGRFIAGATERSVHVWETQGGRLLRVLGETGPGVRQIAFSPDSRLLLIVGAGRAVRVHEVESGTVRFEAQMNDLVSNAAWNPNGSQFAAGGAEGTIRLWAAANGRIERDLFGPKTGVLGIAYNPDGKLLAAVYNDDALRFFMTSLNEMIAYARARVSRELTCAERTRYLHETLTCPP